MSVYGKFYRSIMLPIYETHIRKRDTLNNLAEMEKVQWMTEEKIKGIQFDKLQKILEYSFKHVPFYNNRFKELGISLANIKSSSDLIKIPVLRKEEIHENHEKLIATNRTGQKLYNSATGGSTGKPLRFQYDHESYAVSFCSWDLR
ncbi:MAG: hypothetical protein P9M03_13315 [Candidatus Theseobacter exili]|nr:hypothetical protein [Candidatus Theseobacter exili]